MPEHREMDVGGSPCVGMVAPRISARFDRDEFVIACGIGFCATGSGEIRIERRGVLIDNMNVTAARIGLPDFEQRMRHASPVFIANMAVHNNAFAEGFTLVLDREIVIALAHGLLTVNRPGQLGQRVRHHNQGLGR